MYEIRAIRDKITNTIVCVPAACAYSLTSKIQIHTV